MPVVDRLCPRAPSANARVIVLTRVDPALRLARLRAAGALAEVRAANSRSRPGGARSCSWSRSLELETEEIEVLVERTEGWPAALVLAAVAADRRGSRRGRCEFGGDHRFVADYLSGEVLAALDEDAARSSRASVLGEFTAELCDAVLDRTDSAAGSPSSSGRTCSSRARAGGWFRIHSLFAEYARAQLAAVEPDAARRIHRRAAEWLRSRGCRWKRSSTRLRPGTTSLVAELLAEYHLSLIRTADPATLLRWVRTLPDDADRRGIRSSRRRPRRP